jgi:hypothetical protein
MQPVACAHHHHAPPHTVSGAGVQAHVLKGIACLACTLCVLWVLVIVGLCALLYLTNTDAVHIHCPALWDYVLAAMVLPLFGPLLALLYVPGPSLLSFACPAIFTLVGLIVSVQATLQAPCIETLRAATPPFPWLLCVAWLKTMLYFGAAIKARSST